MPENRSRKVSLLQEVTRCAIALENIVIALKEGFTTMADEAANLTAIVQEIADKVSVAATDLTTEVQQISDQLANASDATLRQTVNDQIARLQNVSSALTSLDETIKGIVP